jgi:23S rRNA U2552 (ribose-2'-O)-methylase RlmE/FtsJ
MMQKLIIDIHSNNTTEYDVNESLKLNKTLCHISHNVKDHISNYCNSKCNDWDIMKKITNPYELIFTNCCKESLSKKRPISRAYFKLREIMYDFVIPWIKNNINIKTCHIAEAPGGFIECVLDIENEHHIKVNEVYGITYISYDKRVPNWRISKDYMYKVYLNNQDGNNDGNIYNINNIDKFVNKTGENTCFIVTADGGFDCSNDFNVQEMSFAHMLLCEIYIACRTQKKNGVFIVKIFDIFTEKTLRLISLLDQVYQTVHIVKPYTSRPANSEKYIISRGFLGVDKIKNEMKAMRESIILGEEKLQINIPNNIRKKIDEFNIQFTLVQNMNIIKTIASIELNKNDKFNSIKNSMYKNQVELSKNFCLKYQV